MYTVIYKVFAAFISHTMFRTNVSLFGKGLLRDLSSFAVVVAVDLPFGVSQSSHLEPCVQSCSL